jgi:hypothetical protein
MSRLSRLCVGVHAHVAKIMAKARLHKRAGGGIKRLAGRTQNISDMRWRAPGWEEIN